MLASVAKYAARYEVTLYALAIEGSHVHIPALFRRANRASFMRDVNSSIARAVPRYTPEYDGGRLWGRRYSSEFLPENEDVEYYFFYTVLQPVQDGLVERISEFPGYNCFHDAVHGIPRTFTVTHWAEYNAARRFNPAVRLKDYQEKVTLKFARLPGYEHLPQREYVRMMYRKLEERRVALVEERKAAGLGFLGREALLRMRRGSLAYSPKESDITSHRPRVLCVNPARRAYWLSWYFEIYFAYREASRRFRAGDRSACFPEGTYPPSLPADGVAPI